MSSALMLRKRSRPVSSGKQTIVSDHNNNNNSIASASAEKSHKATSFLFNPPRIIKDFFISRDHSSQQTTIMSPSSVLDTKPLFPSVLPTSPPLWIDNKIQNPQTLPSQRHQHSWEHPGIGLALIDKCDEDERDPTMGPTNTITKTKTCKERSKLVVFGSQLKIQIPVTPPPQPPPLIPPTSPQSPMEFGIKTPKFNLKHKEDHYTEKRRLSITDMELSEDYTCVISHGPNPKTTHIFGNCIVESSFNAASNTPGASTASSTNGFERNFLSPRNKASAGCSFLSFCHHCNSKIGHGKDIYMYRGEKAFCSQECRGQEMLFDGIES